MSIKGNVFAVVGPSGAGKDTLLAAALAQRPEIHRVRRVITRPETAGGEDFEGVTEQEFAMRRLRGDFILNWRAHGLCYGLPRRDFAGGGDVIFNGSRQMLAPAAAVFPGLRIILVTAPPEVLASRLSARGRESREEVVRRLERSERTVVPEGLAVRTVDNGGRIEESLRAFLDALEPLAETQD